MKKVIKKTSKQFNEEDFLKELYNPKLDLEVIKAIRSKVKNNDNKIESIIKALKAKKYKKEEIKMAIYFLRRTGEIYLPKQGYLMCTKTKYI